MNVDLKTAPNTSSAPLRALAGKVAIVTGSTSGIGLGIARALASQGASIVVNGLGRPAAITNTVMGLKSEFGVEVTYSDADMSHRDSIAAMIAKTLGAHRAARYPREQCRHPACQPDRAIPARDVGCDHRHQPLLGLPRDQAGPSRDA